MNRCFENWVEQLIHTPGEKFDLSSIARHKMKLREVVGNVDMQPALSWSGRLRGKPETVNNIILSEGYRSAPENILPIGGGTSMGIFLVCTALLKPGDEVISHTPGWPQVGAICERMGIPVKWLRLKSNDGWRLDLDQVKGLITPNTRLLYINYPHNPTGAVISESEMIAICNLASKHGIYLLSDEINHGLEWDGEEKGPSAVNYYERSISVSSLSKRFGAAGIRYGWIATRDSRLYDDCLGIYYDSSLCHNHPSELIAAKILEPDNYARLLSESREIGKTNRQVLDNLLSRKAHWDLTVPSGSFCSFPRYQTDEPSWDLFLRMLNRKPVGVEIMPGVCFGEAHEFHIRIGLGQRPDDFKEGLTLLDQGITEHGLS